MQRYKGKKIRVCDKNSIPLEEFFLLYHIFNLILEFVYQKYDKIFVGIKMSVYKSPRLVKNDMPLNISSRYKQLNADFWKYGKNYFDIP